METPPINARIAAQLRHLRQTHSLSLDALATASGVSRSTISQIERAEASPTAIVLEKLAAALGVPLARLFDPVETVTPQPLARRAAQPVWRDPDSGYLRRNLSPPNWPSPLRLVEVSFPPGATLRFENAGLNPREAQQIWLIEGEMAFRVGDRDFSLSAGDCLAMQLDQPIVFHNPGTSAARYLVALGAN